MYNCTNNSAQVYMTRVTESSYHSGMWQVLFPKKCILLQKVQMNHRLTKDSGEMLDETVTKVSILIVKGVLYWHNLKGCSAKKKPPFQNHYKMPDYGFKKGEGACKLKNISPTMKHRSSNKMLWKCLNAWDWCTSKHWWYYDKGKLYGYIEATS